MNDKEVLFVITVVIIVVKSAFSFKKKRLFSENIYRRWIRYTLYTSLKFPQIARDYVKNSNNPLDQGPQITIVFHSSKCCNMHAQKIT